MAPKNTPQQPNLETKPEQDPKLNLDQKKVNGPEDSIIHIQKIVESLKGDSIEKVRTIVETLHKMVPPVVEPKSTQAKVKKPRGASTGEQSTKPTSKDESDNSIDKLKRNLRLLEEDVAKLRLLNQVVGEEVSGHITPLRKVLLKLEKDINHAKLARGTTNDLEDINNARAAKGTTYDSEDIKNAKLTKGMKKDLEDINKKIFNLMCQVPLLPNKSRKAEGLDSDAGNEDNNHKGIVCLHGIHANDDDLKKRAVFRYVQREFKELSFERQICLLSFAVFPENQEVNRTMLMYWWIGEGLIPYKVEPPQKGVLPDEKKRPENVVKEILKEFTDKKLIEAVENKRKVEPNSYKMNPFVHSSVVLISKEIGLFDMYHKGEKPTMNKSTLNKVCLVEDSSSQTEAKAKKMDDKYQIETVFNVSERFPDFTFKWFAEDVPAGTKRFGPLSKNTYKELKVFYLGRWERTAKRHIEVENPELMKFLKNMTRLKLLSFQGISRIERLDDAVCKLHKLIILDLRACYNLEKLPDKIDSLKKLAYLDITDCYMVDRMPKRLSWLNNLEVLKGFVVSDALDEETFCTLPELKYLKKLRKLSITINKGDFTVTDLFLAIQDFKALEKLKVAWGGMNEHKKDATGGQNFLERTATYILRMEAAAEPNTKKTEKPKPPPVLPESMRKLDLQCFPYPELPTWLEPEQLRNLEKLYIKGGKELTRFGKSPPPEKPTKCNVKVLRLKFLPRLKVEWRDLKELYFPKMDFLEKYQCPQVSLCPCDGIGIWRNPEKLQVLGTQN